MDNMLSVRDMNVFQTMFGPESPFLALASISNTTATDFTVNGTASAKPGLGLRWYITDIIFAAEVNWFPGTSGGVNKITLSTATGTFWTQPVSGGQAAMINNVMHFKFRKPLAVLGYNEKLTAQLTSGGGTPTGSLHITILGYTGG